MSSAIVKKTKDEIREMLDQRKLLRQLRQDLERVRLLCELIRKREQRKREIVASMHQVTELKCFPFIRFLRQVMESLQVCLVHSLLHLTYLEMTGDKSKALSLINDLSVGLVSLFRPRQHS